jgi:hypothetical protein
VTYPDQPKRAYTKNEVVLSVVVALLFVLFLPLEGKMDVVPRLLCMLMGAGAFATLARLKTQ